MLGLLVPTDPSWLDAARGQLDRLLSDHARCELEAAPSAPSPVGRFGGEAPEIAAPLLARATVETGRFDPVHRRVGDRGGTLAIPASDGYVVAARRAAREDHQAYPVPLDRLLDRLLICALIEDRSRERFGLLAGGRTGAEPRGLRLAFVESAFVESAFVESAFVESEARNDRPSCRLAEERCGVEAARARLSTLAARGAEVAGQLPLGPTVHG